MSKVLTAPTKLKRLPSAPLKLPGVVTSVSLDLPKDLTFDQWLKVGKGLAVAETRVQWWVGDWWAYGEHSYGDRLEAFKEKALGHYSFGGLKNLGYVSTAVTRSRRRDLLSHAHHVEVAPLNPNEQDEWLERAVSEQWSRRVETSRRREVLSFVHHRERATAQSGDNEWFTPVEILDAAREVMGGIDPNAAKSFRRIEQGARRDYRQRFFWRRGTNAPQRGPDLGAVVR